MHHLKTIIGIILVALLVSCNQQASKNTTHGTITPQDKEILRNLKEELWPKAYRTHDTILLDKILDKSFELIDGTGNRYTKKDELNWIKENATDYDFFRYEIKRLDIYDNGTAVISGTGYIYKDSTYNTYESSNILIKKGTNWKAISSHVSGFKSLNK